MLQKTHSAAGLVAAELVIIYHDGTFWSWEAAGALLLGCLAGPLADVDKQGSTMAKLLFPVSALLRLLDVRHRTMTHSLVFILTLMVLSLPLSPLYHAVFIAAYLSHPLIDLFNEQGVHLFWPLKLRVRLLPKFLAVDTGSTNETVFRWMLLAVGIWLPISTISIPRIF